MSILYIQPLFIGTTEIILIGVAALLIFGGKKLPEMMRGLGKGVKEFKSGMTGEDGGQAENQATEEKPLDKDKSAGKKTSENPGPIAESTGQMAESEEDAGHTA